MICKERLVEKKLSVGIVLYCIVVIRRKEANVTKKDGKEG